MQENTIKNNIPLCVDLDGTLIATDTLLESVIIAVKKNPLLFVLLPFWLLRGKLFFKNQVNKHARVNAALLPYRAEVLEYIRSAKATGTPVYLATATVSDIAEDVANHLDIFDGVFCSSIDNNLRSQAKRDMLVNALGEKGYDYIGDSDADIKVWNSARHTLIVGNKDFSKQLDSTAVVSKIFNTKNNNVKLIFKQIRVHQWVKNVLLFLPLLMAHKFAINETLQSTVLAFIAMSFIASFVYVLNDLLDIESDRQHPRKCFRPIASGSLSIKVAFAIVPLLFIFGLAITLLLPFKCQMTLLLYFIITTAYSFKLKSIYIVDIIILSSLYTLRLIVGAFASDVYISPWLLEFSIFIFLSLATVKRYTELKLMKDNNRTETKGRGYIVSDLSLLRSIGPASGYISVLILTLYLNSKEVVQLYNRPEFLWPVSICVLFWITRVWFMAHRGKMYDDPIVFTAKDKISYLIALIIVLLAVGATL